MHVAAALVISKGADFSAYYWAGYVTRSGRIDVLYDYQVQKSDPINYYRIPYAYSPAFAYLMAPWTLLSPQSALRLWLLISLAIYMYVVYKWSRELWPGNTSAHRNVMIMALVSGVFVSNQANGQVNVLLLALLSGAIWLSRMSQTEWLAGLLWGLSMHTKPLPAVLFLVWWRKPRIFLAAAAGFLVPNILAGPSHIIEYFQYTLEHIGRHAVTFRFPWNASVYGFLQIFADHPDIPYFVLLIFGLVLTAIAVLRSKSEDLSAGLSLSFILLFATMTQSHHLVLGVIPWLMLLAHWQNGPYRHYVGAATAAASFGLLLHPFTALGSPLEIAALAGPLGLWVGMLLLVAAPLP